MSRVTLFVCLVVAATVLGCARKFVVERNFGRIDDQRSISTNSDSQWTVQKEPAKAPAPAP